MTFNFSNQINAPFGEQGIRPILNSSFRDFVSAGFAYDWEAATYTIRPLFLSEWLQQYSLRTVGRRNFVFDHLQHATMCFFVTCVKIAFTGTPLDLREELQGLAVPTYVQDCHSFFPPGGRFRSQPFEFQYVFCPIWLAIFNVNPDGFSTMLKNYSRSLLENGFPLVRLDFGTYHEQCQNMITSVTETNPAPTAINISEKKTAKNASGVPFTVNLANSVTVRYAEDGQLVYNWQTTCFTWFSITNDRFADVYNGLAKKYTLRRRDMNGFLNGAVSWYLSTRGGAAPVPNFVGTSGTGSGPTSGGSDGSSGSSGGSGNTGGSGGSGGGNVPKKGNNPKQNHSVPKQKMPPSESKKQASQKASPVSPPVQVQTSITQPRSISPPQPMSAGYNPGYVGVATVGNIMDE